MFLSRGYTLFAVKLSQLLCIFISSILCILEDALEIIIILYCASFVRYTCLLWTPPTPHQYGCSIGGLEKSLRWHFLIRKLVRNLLSDFCILEIHSKFPQTLNWYWLFAILPTHLQVPHKSGCSNLISGPQSQKSVHFRHVHLMYQMFCSMQICEMHQQISTLNTEGDEVSLHQHWDTSLRNLYFLSI